MKQVQYRHEVLDSIPEALEANILYVTKEGDVAGHLCACGCGREVITPLSPTDWSLTVDRRGVSLDPSIGNWAFACRSHYFIWDGVVVWAGDMSHEAIALGRQRDKAFKALHYQRQGSLEDEMLLVPALKPESLWQRFRAWWRSKSL